MPPSRKDIAEKLLAMREQSEEIGRTFYLPLALLNLDIALKFLRDSLAKEARNHRTESVLRELIKYLPIGTVACMETFFRGAIQQLVGHGEPYAPRAVKLLENSQAKLDFDIFWAVHQKKFTLGEFVSHVVSLQNLKNINFVASTLLDADFLAALRDVDLTSKKFPQESKRLKRIGDDSSRIFKEINRIVELRQNFAHQADFVFIDDDTIEDICTGFEATRTLLIASHLFFWRLLNPGYEEPVSQVEIGENAFRRYREVDNQLEAALVEYKKYITAESARELDEFQVDWKQFRERKAAFAANEYRGGTIMGTIRAGALEEFTRPRLEEVLRKTDAARKRLAFLKKNA